MKKFWLCMLALGSVLGMVVPAIAADFPKRSITIVNAWLPGGIVELGFRPVLEEMARILGVNLVLSPNAGAGGAIGANKARAAKSDGYTLLLSTDVSLMTLSQLRKVRFTTDDFIPVCTYGASPMALSVNKSDGRFGTFAEFIDYAKAHPGELSIGISGKLSADHVAAVSLMQAAGIQLKMVPFDGALGTASAIASRHIDCGVCSILYNESVIPLAFFGKQKNTDFPDVPTLAGAGYDIDWGQNFGLFALRGTDPTVVGIIEEAMRAALENPRVLENLQQLSITRQFYWGEGWRRQIADRSSMLQELIAAGLIVPEGK